VPNENGVIGGVMVFPMPRHSVSASI
jgi:tellurite resistance protein TehA-like permease